MTWIFTKPTLPPMLPRKMEVSFILQKGHGDSHEKKEHDGRVRGKSHGSDFSASST